MSEKRGECQVCQTLTTKQCVSCKKVFYCSTEHQKKDWKRHKLVCKPADPRSQGNAAASSNINNPQMLEKSQAYSNQVQRQEQIQQNQGVSGNNNAVNQANNNAIQQNQSMKSSNQMNSINQSQNYVQGNPQTNRSINNLPNEQSINQLNPSSYSNNMHNANSPMNVNSQNQNSYNDNGLYNNQNAKMKQDQKEVQDKKIDPELNKLYGERMALRSEVVKLLAKFKYNEATIPVQNLCQKSDQIYNKELTLDQLYELLADQLLEVKIIIKTKTNNDNKIAVQKLQDIFHRIKNKIDDNYLKIYQQQTQSQNDTKNKNDNNSSLHQARNKLMNEIRKRCNLISLVANLFYSLGYYKDCEEAYVRYVKLIENVFGQDALETSNCYFLMGVYYLQHRYYVKALSCFKRSMSIRSQKLSEKHESVTDCMYNIGITYKQMGKKQKAQEQLEKTLYYRRQVIGESSLPVAQTLEILGKIYIESSSDYPIALTKFSECYSIRKSIIQNNKHPDMVRISLLIVHLYNLIKSQLAQQEVNQPSKQLQQIKDIELEMQKNVIDGNIQHYIQTQKSNPDRFQELQNQCGIQNVDIQTGASNQNNMSMNKLQNIIGNSASVIPENAFEEQIKAQTLTGGVKNGIPNGANGQMNGQGSSGTLSMQQKQFTSGPKASIVAFQNQLKEQREAGGSIQSKDSISPYKGTFDQEDSYSPPQRNKKRSYSRGATEDNSSDEEYERGGSSKKFAIKLKKSVLFSMTSKQIDELVKLNVKVNEELKKDPNFQPRDLIVNSLFVQNVKEMNYKEICQDLIDMNPEIFKAEDFQDLRYLGGGNDNNFNGGFGNGPSSYEKRISFQPQPSIYDQYQQNNYGLQSQNSFGNDYPPTSYSQQEQQQPMPPRQQQSRSKYDMEETYSFPQDQPQKQPKQEYVNSTPLKFQDQRVGMQMDSELDYEALLNNPQNNNFNNKQNGGVGMTFGNGSNDFMPNNQQQQQQFNPNKYKNNDLPQIKFPGRQNDDSEERLSKVNKEENAMMFLNAMKGTQGTKTPIKNPNTQNQNLESNNNLNYSSSSSPPLLISPEKLDPNYQQNQLSPFETIINSNNQKINNPTNQKTQIIQVQQVEPSPNQTVNKQKSPTVPFISSENTIPSQVPSNVSSPDKQQSQYIQKLEQELSQLRESKKEQTGVRDSQNSVADSEKDKINKRNSQLEKEKKDQIKEISQLKEQLRSKTNSETQFILEESIRRKTTQLQKIDQEIEAQSIKQKELEKQQVAEQKEIENEQIRQKEQRIKELEDMLKKQQKQYEEAIKLQNSQKQQKEETGSHIKSSIKHPSIPPPPPPMNFNNGPPPPPFGMNIPPPPPNGMLPPPPPPNGLLPPPPINGIPPPPNGIPFPPGIGLPMPPPLNPDGKPAEKSKTKQLHVDQIESVSNTFWAGAKPEKAAVFDDIEEMFPKENPFKKQMTQKTPSQKYLESVNKGLANQGNQGANAGDSTPKTLFKADRQKNLTIDFLMLFKTKDKTKDIIPSLLEAFEQLDEKIYTEDTCRKIQKVLNNPDDVRMFEEFQGDTSTLDDNLSKFFVGIIRVNNYKNRLNMLIFKQEYTQKYNESKNNLTKIQQASIALKENESFQQFLFQARELNKVMNRGLPKENIKGIKLQSILDLKQQKNSDQSMDILQYLVTKINNQIPEMLKFVDELPPLIKDITNLDSQEEQNQAKQLIDKFNTLGNKLNEIKSEQNLDMNFYQFFQPFYQDNYQDVIELEQILQKTKQSYNQCLQHYGETSEKIKSYDFFKLIQSICDKVKNEIPQKKQKIMNGFR